MNMALAILFLWIGCALLFLASHGMQADSPWAAFKTLLSTVNKQGE